MLTLYLDTETYSPTPIKHGLYRYAETVEVMLVTWAIDEGEVNAWDRTATTMPPELRVALTHADTVVIHNSQFDRTVTAANGFPTVQLERTFDTMAGALSHGLPGRSARCAMCSASRPTRPRTRPVSN